MESVWRGGFCTPTFTAALFTRSGNNFCVHQLMIKCGTCDDGILFSQKKNEILSFVTMWMDLKIIMLVK
jgi:hypothetical protein